MQLDATEKQRMPPHAVVWVNTITLTLLCAFLSPCESSSQREHIPDQTLLNEYDFIIVGGGTAGSVVAKRLSENKQYNVLVLEAGGEMTDDLYVPFFSPFATNENNSWQYETAPQLHALLPYGLAAITLGKVIGGTGSINSMNFVRGSQYDFNNWEKIYKADGWNYANVLNYFKKIEYFNVTGVEEADIYHGFQGETPINYPAYETQLCKVFLDACNQSGYQFVDYNGKTHKGYSRVQSNTAGGMRMGPSTCFLDPTVRNRSNLHIWTHSVVTKITFQNKRATGVIFKKNGVQMTAKASLEVILCAGAVNTPKLLMLSGIGLQSELQKHNIKPVTYLPVGQGLQDHVIFLGLVVTTTNDLIGLDKLNASIQEYREKRTGLLTIPGAFEAIVFENSGVDSEEDNPDVELELIDLFPGPEIKKSRYVTDEIYKKYYEPMFGRKGFMNAVAMVRPKSRGSVNLRSSDPDAMPFINPNLLYEEDDITRIVNGTLKLKKLFETQAMKDIGANVWEEPFPYCQQFKPVWSVQYTTCLVQHIAFPGQHVCCTCAMGDHERAVVDKDLRVKGIDGLRVIDASVMPAIVSGNTFATVLMIGEKGAALILEDAKNNKPVKS